MRAIVKLSPAGWVAGSCAALAALCTWLYLQNLERDHQESGEMTPVLVANRYVAKGTILQAALFDQSDIPRAFLQPGAVTDFDLLQSSGHPLYRSQLPIPAGAQLMQRDLQSLATAEFLSHKIPPDLVAVSFAVDAARSIGGNIRPGDFIDVLETSKPILPTDKPLTRIVLQAAQVLAVGRRWSMETRETPSNNPAAALADDDALDATVLTIAATPFAATRLAQLRESSILSVFLRSPGDTRVYEALP